LLLLLVIYNISRVLPYYYYILNNELIVTPKANVE
jgi:hypothetical protein